MSSFPPIRIMYTNWKGERRERYIQPEKWWFGITQWHPQPQYLVQAIDLEDGKRKDFAMSGFDKWPTGEDNGDSGDGQTSRREGVQGDLSKM